MHRHPCWPSPRVVCTPQEEMEKKVEKWQEPPPAKQTKVLPAPDMEPKKRRGGRRFRKMKERYGLTGASGFLSHPSHRMHAVHKGLPVSYPIAALCQIPTPPGHWMICLFQFCVCGSPVGHSYFLKLARPPALTKHYVQKPRVHECSYRHGNGHPEALTCVRILPSCQTAQSDLAPSPGPLHLLQMCARLRTG